MAETYDFDRKIPARYRDPLDVVWIATAKRLGLTIRRSPEVYACSDGRGTMTLTTAEAMDPDDTVAQLIFHELCHWIINGVETVHQPDWGFPLDWEEDGRELTCQRLQAALAAEHGVRDVLASTGTYRPYFDRLTDPLEPLDDTEKERALAAAARDALRRSKGPPWAVPLGEALAATRALATVVAPFLPDYDGDQPADELPCLWDKAARP